MRLNPSTVVGRDATVELRRDTLLGDTYVAITNPGDAYSHPIERGATIGKNQVKPPVQIEGLLNSLANFVGGGSLPQLGNTFDRLVKRFPGSAGDAAGEQDARRDATRPRGPAARAEEDAGSRVDDDHQACGNGDPVEVHAESRGMMMVDSATTPAQIVELLGRLGTALIPTLPAVPVFNALAEIIERVVKPLLIPGWPDYFGQASNPQALLDVFTSRLVPFLKAGPAANVNSVAIENDVSNPQLADIMLRQMRMMGMVR